MISTIEAQKKILASDIKRKISVSQLLKSEYRVLAQKIRAPRDLPPFDRATMDGIAICEKKETKVGQEFSIVGEIQAGANFSQKKTAALQDQEAVWIMTGAALPKGASRVIPKECLQKTKDGVKLYSLPVNKCFAPQAQDAKKGQTLLDEHQIIDSNTITFLASLGQQTIKTFAPPQVAILSTGNEIVDASQTPTRYQITDINSILLETYLKAKNIPCQKLGIVRDQKESLAIKIKEAMQYDVFLISGGVSAGKYDFIPELLQKHGYQQVFHKVKIKPGKPLWFGRKKQKVVFGLPGNPVSVQVCYKIFVEPYLKYFLGYPSSECLPKWYIKKISPPLKNHFALETYYPAKKTALTRITAKPFHTSGDFLSLIASDGLVKLRPSGNPENFKPQTLVSFLPWKT